MAKLIKRTPRRSMVSNKLADVGDGYRLIEAHEIIRSGDEWTTRYMAEWDKVYISIGKQYGEQKDKESKGFRVRRRI